MLELFADPGQVAFPGGKADSTDETPFETARREALEEIGLPLSDDRLPPDFRIEHLCELPTHFARTELGVRPCVAYLHSGNDSVVGGIGRKGDVEGSLIPRLDKREVAAVFTAGFRDFLRRELLQSGAGKVWYEGIWVHWHGTSWRMHSFHVVVGEGEGRLVTPGDCGKQESYRVFGMTARMLVDAARVAYGEEPAFEHNRPLGDEDLIRRLLEEGKLPPIEKKRAVRI